MTTQTEHILGRPTYEVSLAEPLRFLHGKKVLITGADGSIGGFLADTLYEGGIISEVGAVKETDIDTLDVRDHRKVDKYVESFRPDVIFHLAGAKHAPEGELNPAAVARTNVAGTVNIVNAAWIAGAHVILASTCKACDPETSYGASKLLAERITLQAGGSVARLYNVVETSGNVFEIWGNLSETDKLPVTACERYFIALKEAVALLIWTTCLPRGRYAVNPGSIRTMVNVAKALYPGREQIFTEKRRGDRLWEPLIGSSERVEPVFSWVNRIYSPHEEVSS